MVKKEENTIEYAIRVLNNTLIHFNTLSCNDIKRRMTDVVSELKELLISKGENNDSQNNT